MQSIRSLVVVMSSVLVLLVVGGGNCSRPVTGEGEGEGEGPRLCTADVDCGPEAQWDCNGTCQQICNGVDSVCPLDEYCANTYCAKGCRDSATCNPSELCRDGVCVAGGQSECSSKCDCAPGEVCNQGSCDAPELNCAQTADCPRGPADQCDAYLCDGLRNICLDPSPDPCANDAECVGRPGCLGGTVCVCSPSSSRCVPNAACTPQTEEVCGVGFYCSTDLACAALPSCGGAGPDPCTPQGLVCSPGAGRCERPESCTTSADCAGVAGRTYCATGFCATASCTNGGVTCSTTEECGVSGRCVPAGTGTACQGDGTCPADQYCNLSLAVPECAVGCRNSTSCAANQECNGAHACVNTGGGSTGQYGAACADDAECAGGLTCGGLTNTCAETCQDPADCVACNAVEGGGCTCEQLFLLSYCQPP
jgi:hypothetical protein